MSRFPSALGRKLAACCFVLLLLLGAGCGDNRVEAPKVDPVSASQKAMDQYDASKDGFLDAAELEQCPSMKQSLSVLDRDNDGKVSQTELQAHLDQYVTSKMGLIHRYLEVKLDGQPLADAQVALVPESFLDGVQQASGTTKADGMVAPTVPDTAYPGVRCGFYRVEISKKDGSGNETLPARYNTQTTLGIEIGPNERGGNPVFLLTSR